MDQAPFSNAVMLSGTLAILAHSRRPRAVVGGLALAGATLVGSNACTEHLLQTATLDAAEESSGGSSGLAGSPNGGDSAAEQLTCDGSTTGSLPLGAAFGEGRSEESWAFAAGEYAVSRGPGIALVARDAFRLYVNGVLLSEGTGARAPLFLPLTLPPGDNVIALAVAADSGTPAALVHIDELDRAVVSDDSWRYSLHPEENWTSPGFDDGDWPTATELAHLGEVPGCDPEVDFPESSHARWIGPPLGTGGPIGLRTVVRIAPLGFGEGTTGGGEAVPESPISWEELRLLAATDAPKVLLLSEGTHDFRRTGDEISDQEVCASPCANDPNKMIYQVLVGDATCPNPLTTMPRNERTLDLGSNTTLLGLGRGATLRGVTINFQDSENLIVRNIAVVDVNPGLIEAGDAFSLFRPNQVWVDHGTTKWISDGFTDLREGTRNVTISHMRYEGESEYDCEGAHARTSLVEGSQVTFYHNRFNQIRYNAPGAKGNGARAHLFNNLYSNVAGWAIGSACQAAVLAEGNVFENVDVVGLVSDCGTDTTLGSLNFPSESNLYRDGTPVFLGGDGSEPHEEIFTPPYEYELEAASEAWPRVVSRAGAGGPWALPLTLD